MSPATGEATVSIRIRIPQYNKVRSAKVVQRYLRRYPAPEQGQLDEVKLADLIQGPTQVTPQWLETVQDRLFGSIAPRELEASNDGRWLLGSVAVAASEFFEMAAEALPSEPHLSGSENGELIAEFVTTHGTMTSIITDSSVLLFAVARQRAPIQKTFSLDSTDLLEELRRISELLQTGKQGQD